MAQALMESSEDSLSLNGVTLSLTTNKLYNFCIAMLDISPLSIYIFTTSNIFHDFAKNYRFEILKYVLKSR